MEKIDDYIKRHVANKEKSQDFVDYLLQLMEKHGFKNDPDLYNKANISRQSWNAIINRKVEPQLNTALKIIFALEADNHECKYLLKKIGITLASSSKFALVVRYCIENKIYDLYEVNKFLEQQGCEYIV